GENGRTIDRVSSYFGMRKIALSQGKASVTYILLNNMPYFMFGPLDQGFWPDGLYTAPTDEALRYDIEMTKKLGFNTARKHVKVEPQRWYYWCDKLGLLVWQDMPSGDMVDTGGKPEMQRTPASAAQFELELTRMIESLANHPCIVMWVPFNEGWGQYDTARIAELVRKRDPTRLVNAASGWHDMRIGDAHDIHVYPGPSCPEPEPARAAVLGEFGGLGLPLRGHTWLAEKSWGYRSFTTPAELTDAYVGLIEKLVPLVTDGGLSAAIYTQTSDVEIEVNGLMTYDRAVVKMDAERITEANRKVWWRPPVHRIFAP
ncbi:MAG TPA: glycoside hydrolase family 2 TIM barrel-domain containing protein, partial [Phycisphaerae bacterium]|nr:glycoside hydrolase family 2 TIM barrel-domain containing protein [Phycisphaerae bacterium]